jgi:hypothetical protein
VIGAEWVKSSNIWNYSETCLNLFLIYLHFAYHQIVEGEYMIKTTLYFDLIKFLLILMCPFY